MLAGHSDLPKGRCKALPLSEEVEVHNLTWKEKKKSHAEVAKICGKNEFSICEIVKL